MGTRFRFGKITVVTVLTLRIAEGYQIIFVYFKMVTMVNFMVSFSITIHVNYLSVAVSNVLGICFGPWFQRGQPAATWLQVLGRAPQWWACVLKGVSV